MKKWLLAILLTGAFGGLSFTNRKTAFFRVPERWPTPTYNFNNNRLTREGVLLGRALFYDPILSADSTISCASCHLQYTAFTHVDHNISHGIYGRIGTRNSPALANLAWSRLLMWDGAVNHLDVQPLAPIANKDEMDFSLDSSLIRLRRSALYSSLFRKAFGDTSITGERFLKSLSQFMLTIVSANSKYDRLLRHEKGVEFTRQEQNGLRLFRQHCENCHKEPLFTTGEFANNGLSIDTLLRDPGRMRVTGSRSDSLHFKIPSLRNVEFSYPYMHDGRFDRLQQVIEHYTSGIRNSDFLSPELREPIILSANEKVDMIAFLLTLTDKEFLYDTSFSYPRFLFTRQPKE
jgi:cytochrome c peroxidase